MPKRARPASASVARSPKEAAIQLVRLEFDATRLRMGISQAEDRMRTYRDELARNDAQRDAILALLRD